MPRVLQALDENAERWVMLICYTFCCIVIVHEVVRRFDFNFSSAWGEEAARYAFIYLGGIGAAYAVRERAHIRFDIVLGRVGPRTKAGFMIFAELATIVFASIALYWSLHTIRQLLQFEGATPVLRINKAWFEAAVPIGFALILWPSMQGIARDWRDLRAGRGLRRQSHVRGMSGMNPVVLSVLGLIGLLVVGVPCWVAMGLGTVAMLSLTQALPLTLVGEALFEGVDSFALIAIPLFVLTGDAMVRTGLGEKLLNFAEASFGSLRSGFGTSTVMGCGLFACISGSDAADAAAVGRLTMDRLVAKGYPKPYACALVASGACTGILIPPSITYIIIGLVLGVSSATLFLAAFVPGVIVQLSVMVTNAVINRIHGHEKSTGRFDFGRWLRALWAARFALAIPLVILGGIYSGVFTPTESAAVAVTVAVATGLAQGRLALADFPAMLGTSARVCGVVLPIIAVALLFSQALTVLDVPQTFVAWVMGFGSDRNSIVILLLLIWIVAGMFMETGLNIVVLGPLLWPLAQAVGMQQVHFCVFMITTLGLGFITPPFGLNLFAMSGLTRVPVASIAARALPFAAVMVAVSALIGFVPQISMFMISK